MGQFETLNQFFSLHVQNTYVWLSGVIWKGHRYFISPSQQNEISGLYIWNTENIRFVYFVIRNIRFVHFKCTNRIFQRTKYTNRIFSVFQMYKPDISNVRTGYFQRQNIRTGYFQRQNIQTGYFKGKPGYFKDVKKKPIMTFWVIFGII